MQQCFEYLFINKNYEFMRNISTLSHLPHKSGFNKKLDWKAYWPEQINNAIESLRDRQINKKISNRSQ